MFQTGKECLLCRTKKGVTLYVKLALHKNHEKAFTGPTDVTLSCYAHVVLTMALLGSLFGIFLSSNSPVVALNRYFLCQHELRFPIT